MQLSINSLLDERAFVAEELRRLSEARESGQSDEELLRIVRELVNHSRFFPDGW